MQCFSCCTLPVSTILRTRVILCSKVKVLLVLLVLLPGLSKKPSLSAQGGPVVRSGENVTLVCSSESAFDQFHLLRDGENLECPLAGGQSPHGALQAEFPLGPGTPAHSGVYRCYGSFTHSPYSWSDSSDPLFLSVTGEEPLPGPCFLVAVQLLSCVQFLETCGLQHDRLLCPSPSPLHGSQPCPGEGACTTQ